MTQPLTNRREVDSRLKQGDGRTVPQRVWVNAFCAQRRRCLDRCRDVLAQEIPRPESGEGLTAGIGEEKCVGGIGLRRTVFGDQITQEASNSGPYRAEPHLVPFPVTANFIRRLEPQVATTQVEDLLDAATRVEHQREQRIVATAR